MKSIMEIDYDISYSRANSAIAELVGHEYTSMGILNGDACAQTGIKAVIQAALVGGYNVGYFKAIQDINNMKGMQIMGRETEILERITRMETNIEHIAKSIEKIENAVVPIPELCIKTNELWDGKKWWKTYLISPIITGIVVILATLLINHFFPR